MVVVGIFEGARERPVVFPHVRYVEGDVAQTVVASQTAVVGIEEGAAAQSQCLNIVEAFNPLADGIGQDGNGVQPNHHVGLAAPHRPHRQAAVLRAEVDETLCHVAHAFGADEREEGMGGAEGVPE